MKFLPLLAVGVIIVQALTLLPSANAAAVDQTASSPNQNMENREIAITQKDEYKKRAVSPEVEKMYATGFGLFAGCAMGMLVGMTIPLMGSWAGCLAGGALGTAAPYVF